MMEILWLAVAFVAGAVAAWIYLAVQHKSRLEEHEAELRKTIGGAETALESERSEHRKTQQSLSKAESREAAARDQAASLQSDQEKSEEKLKKARSEQRKSKRLLTKAESGAASANERVAALETELSGATDKLSSERDAHKKTKQLASTLKSDEAGSAKRVKALETDLEKLRGAADISKAADTAKNDKLKQLQTQNQELGAQVKKAEAAQAKADSERQRLEERLKQAQTESRAEVERSRARVAELQQGLREKDAELTRRGAERAPAESKSQPRPGSETSSTGPATGMPGKTEAGTPPGSPAVSSAAGRPESAEPDDLTRIDGIGETLQGKLAGLGITSFRQIAEFTPSDIERVNAVLNFPGRIERERWVAQARAIVSGERGD